eukprot:TRINITY_DN64021_c0_g1_i1.p1 TRINITY_DN64021_c0_g1~~TRINITY_DN64021_c0_g1_i1.p1  ORF type:complete len:424 (-),score=26.96 TRINITY_DN64021_c0_g1_i1:128-1399(-)
MHAIVRPADFSYLTALSKFIAFACMCDVSFSARRTGSNESCLRPSDNFNNHWSQILQSIGHEVGRGAQSDGVILANLGGTCNGLPVAVKRVHAPVKDGVVQKRKVDDMYHECEMHETSSTTFDKKNKKTTMASYVVPIYDYQPRNSKRLSEGLEPTLYIMMPYLAGGELRSDPMFFRDRNKQKPKNKAAQQLYFERVPNVDVERQFINIGLARMAMDLFAGLHEVHTKGIIHCDIKPANILTSEKDCLWRIYDAWRKKADFNRVSSLCKFMIADMGLAEFARDFREGDSQGTPVYMPPEIKGKHDSAKVRPKDAKFGWTGEGDVYSMGLVFLDFISNIQYSAYLLEKNIVRMILKQYSFLDFDLQYLMTSVLRPSAKHRPTAVEAYGIARRAYTRLLGEPLSPQKTLGVPSCLSKCRSINNPC